MPRIYDERAVQTTLSGGIDASTTTIPLTDLTGWPSPTAGDTAAMVIDYDDAALIETITYTGRSGNTISGVVRGVGKNGAKTHASGAKVRHGAADIDLQSIDTKQALSELATVIHSPAATYTTTSLSDVDVDATNLAVTFTAPANGKVDVTLESRVQGTNFLVWALREGTTTVASLTILNAIQARPRVTMRVTGLTPGTAYTYKWAWRVNTGTGTISNDLNQMRMEVRAVTV